MKQQFSERYQIVDCLQSTHYTNVYIVEDQLLAKKCIAKETLKEADAILIHQFHVEVDVMSQMNHSNVPEILDVLETDESYVIIETYIEGINLADWLKIHSRKNQQLFKTWILVLIDILGYIHRLGYLYVDLKKENLMVKDNDLYLIDFNSCISIENEKVYYASKVNYAPELKEGRKPDERVDIYGLGAILQLFYKHGFMNRLAKRCRHKDLNKRISSLKKVKRYFLIGCIIKHLSFLLTIVVLSVLLLLLIILKLPKTPIEKYLKDPDLILFLDAYKYTLDRCEGEYFDKVSNNLYLWIDKEWFHDEIFKDEKIVRFLFNQALQSKNISYCSYLLDKVDSSLHQKLADLLIIAKAYTEQTQNIEYESIVLMIDTIKAATLSQKQKLEKLQILINVLNECQIVLKNKDLNDLFNLISSFSFEDDGYEDIAISYISYGILISNEDLEFQIPNSFKEHFKNDDSIQEIIHYVTGGAK